MIEEAPRGQKRFSSAFSPFCGLNATVAFFFFGIIKWFFNDVYKDSACVSI